MQLAKIFNKIDNRFRNHKFSGIKFNSQECRSGDIFFAIKGNKNNGNKFINEAIKKGAKTIVSDQKFRGYKNGILFIKSENPRKLLSLTATKIYKSKPKNLIAITGTNGKSSIANFYFQILRLCKKKVATIGTLGVSSGGKKRNSNNTTLDPLSLNKILEKQKKNKIDNVILEASSHGLKQNRLDGISFNVGIFTNLSRDHLDYHTSYKDYFDSKMILFNKLMKKNSKIIYDTDISLSKKLNKISKKKKLKPITLGKKNSELKLIKCKLIGKKQEVIFNFKNHKYSFKTNLIGRIQIKNLLMAILAANTKISMKKIVKSISKVNPVNGRLEKVGNLKNKSVVILDYAHTPEALKICLQNIRDQFKFSEISLVFGCGGERDKIKRHIMGKIANDLCQTIYLTDDNPRKENPKQIRNQIKKKINKHKLFEISSRALAIKKAIENLNSGDVLIVAGKGHENYQEYFNKKYFSDKECILKNIKLKNKKLYPDWKKNIIKEKIEKINFKNIKNINNASINSKEIKKNDIFFGIKGKKFDGNKFANEAIKNGAIFSIIDKNYGKKKLNKVIVKNSLSFLSKLSEKVREVSNIEVIAITGSAGKTSLKELLGQSLNKLVSTSYSKKSFNNKFGVPLTLFNINKKNIFGVFEVGMDKKGEIFNLTKLLKPDMGVITNVSYAHIKNFDNLSKIAYAKSEIIDNINVGGKIVLNKDDKYFNFFKQRALKKRLKIISFSKKKSANVKYIKTEKMKNNFLLHIKVNKKKNSF